MRPPELGRARCREDNFLGRLLVDRPEISLDRYGDDAGWRHADGAKRGQPWDIQLTASCPP